MGTFTKSFGGVGGYLASSKEVVAYLRQVSAGSVYSAGISSPTAQQIYSAMKIIMGEDGTDLGGCRVWACLACPCGSYSLMAHAGIQASANLRRCGRTQTHSVGE